MKNYYDLQGFLDEDKDVIIGLAKVVNKHMLLEEPCTNDDMDEQSGYGSEVEEF